MLVWTGMHLDRIHDGEARNGSLQGPGLIAGGVSIGKRKATLSLAVRAEASGAIKIMGPAVISLSRRPRTRPRPGGD